MAKFNTETLSLFHTFSKTQVNSDAKKPQFSSLGNTVNKSGHTVQSNEIWTEAIPFFGLGVPADFSSTAQVNDLVKDADGVIWQRNATPYTDANGTYWTQKTKSITSFTKGADGKYTFTEEDGALVDGSYLLNAAGVPTVKYHAKKQLTPLVSDNNAFIDSEKDASRLKIDGKWVDQFIGVTDVYVNGSAAVSYAPVLFSNSSSTTPLKAGAGEDYLDYCATGIILWDKSECTGNEVISCFEYVGAKLDTSLSDIRKDVQDIVGTTMEGVVASVTASDAAKSAGIDVDSSTKTSPKITLTTGSVAAGVTKLVTGDTVNTAIKNAIDAIPEVQAATTSVAGVVTISDNDAIATTETSAAAATVAAVAATRSAIASELGALAVTVNSNKTEVDGKISAIEGKLASTGEIGQAIADVKATADTAVQSVTRATGSSTLLTVTDGTDVTISLSSEVATKSDAATAASTAITTSLNGTTAGTIGGAISSAVNGLETKLTTGEGSLGAKVTALEGSVKTINETTIPNAITTAQNGAVATVKALSLSATDSDDAAKVTVTLGGTVETPTITVTSSDIASAQSLSELSSKVNTHIEEAAGLYLSVEKVDALPADAEAKTNKIYLVPVDTEEGREQNIHTEYIWTNGQWEVIGTTAIDMNSLEAAAEAAQAAADKAQGEVDAVEAAIAEMDADLTVNGISVKQVDGKVTELTDALITASIPANTTSVEGNVAYVGTTKHVIAPEKFQTAAQMPATLTSWVADLSNLTVGDSMFANTSLTTFIGDLSSLTSGVDMFKNCTLDAESLEILAENLPSVSGGIIDIGASTNATDEVIATIKGKGWKVLSNGEIM